MESVKEGTAQKIIPYFLGYKTHIHLLMGFRGGGDTLLQKELSICKHKTSLY